MKQILGKLWKIMSEVNYIQKDKTNEFHRYKYASEEAIKVHLHEQLVKHKVIFGLTTSGAPHIERVKTAKGNEELVVFQEVAYNFWDVESGERFGGTFMGTGQDAGDKGLYKALTGAIKYIMTSTFLIPTGTDAEEEPPAKPLVTPKPLPKMATSINEILNKKTELPIIQQLGNVFDLEKPVISWRERAASCTTDDEAGILMEEMKAAKLPKIQQDVIRGILESKRLVSPF